MQTDTGASVADAVAGESNQQPRPVCCHSQLPPSLRALSSAVRIAVDYVVVVAVRRKMMCGIRRTTKVRQELRLRSEPKPNVCSESIVGSLPASALCPGLNKALQDAESLSSMDPGWLPRYTPSVQVEILPPSPPILTSESATPISIVLHIPPELLEVEKIYLRGLLVQLKTYFTATIGGTSGTCTQTTRCWSSQGRVHLDKTRVEVKSGIWEFSIGLDVKPTCQSCTVHLTHFVEAIADISRGNDEITQEKYTHVYHFDSKAAATEYPGHTYSELWKKTSVFQAGFFLTSFLRDPIITPKKTAKNTVQFITLINGDLKLPIIAPDEDSGPLVKDVVEDEPGKNLIGYRTWATMQEFAQVLFKVTRLKVEVVTLPKSEPPVGVPPELAQELSDDFLYWNEFGSEGRDDPTIVHLTAPESIEDYLRKQDWSKILS
ncbi:unnamed protein product [Clonostachys rosea]|uniref:Uncharacterized protein n=1 Tax=Bionectria ochroleuca TaxID=29856 RepID=A0ABY6UR20_BIOOC|nr:unnamed protein product [Clonostachys rosea]